MTIYQHRATITAASGSTNTVTLNVRGGLCRQVMVIANTSTTVFRTNIVDNSSYTVANYGFSRGQLNDATAQIPMAGVYTVNITNASPDDTFRILLGIVE